MAEFIAKHFVATYQQAGDFEVVNVNGRLQKNGGNVASYFCTPEARVIHAVGKPVSGQKLLAEARWAVDTWDRIRQRAPNGGRSQMRLLQQAHLAELGTNLAQFNREYRKELPRAREQFASRMQSIAQRRAKGDYRRERRERVVPPETAARRKAAKRFSGEKAHQILAAEPLASFAQVSRRLFEKLTGERYSERRERVYAAAAGLKKARERDMPLLFVLYRGHGTYKDEPDDSTQEWLQTVLRQRPVAQPLKSFVVIVLPLRELAALSNLAKLPSYELARRSTTVLVLAHPDGSQAAAVDGRAQPQELASRLWPLVAKAAVARAKTLSSGGKHSLALRLLRKTAHEPIEDGMRSAVNRQITRVRFAMAESWANAGKTQNALGQFRLVAKTAADDALRDRALGRIAALQ